VNHTTPTTGPVSVGIFAGYDDPASHFSRRLLAVQQLVSDALSARPPGPIEVIDICGGEGRALLPVLPSHPRRPDVRATIVDIDPASVRAARDAVRAQGLTQVEVREADAGLPVAYAGLERADIAILSGVLRHLTRADRERLLAFLPQVCATGAVVIWTIGRQFDPTRARRISRAIARAGYVPLAERTSTRRPDGGTMRHIIGMSRMTAPPEPFTASGRVFAFKAPVSHRYPRLHALYCRMRSLVADTASPRARTALGVDDPRGQTGGAAP
jgi:ubiquinone/menaquinone biosynthesis C-methylase UbiE